MKTVNHKPVIRPEESSLFSTGEEGSKRNFHIKDCLTIIWILEKNINLNLIIATLNAPSLGPIKPSIELRGASELP